MSKRKADYTPEEWAKERKRVRDRYANDPAYRARVLKWQEKERKDPAKRANKLAYGAKRRSDPAHRAQAAEYHKAWRALPENQAKIKVNHDRWRGKPENRTKVRDTHKVKYSTDSDFRSQTYERGRKSALKEKRRKAQMQLQQALVFGTGFE